MSEYDGAEMSVCSLSVLNGTYLDHSNTYRAYLGLSKFRWKASYDVPLIPSIHTCHNVHVRVIRRISTPLDRYINFYFVFLINRTPHELDKVVL
jgi:hypothetical protein